MSPSPITVPGELRETRDIHEPFTGVIPRHRLSRPDPRHRVEVLANGKDARASLQRVLDNESVIVDWRDHAGAPRTGRAYTGKSFARAGNRQNIAIKYDANFVLEPVILSEASERDRINGWMITTSLWVASAMTLLCVMFVVFKFRSARPPRAADQ